jgi:hypothetical protein
VTQPPPDPDNLPVDADCDDFPKLTAEEWAAVAALSPQPDEDDQ